MTTTGLKPSDIDSKRVLVTGASGFVGHHLVTRLVEHGRNVVALHHRPHSAVKSVRGSSIEWRQVDIVEDDLSSHAVGIDTVFHLAACVRMSATPTDVALMERVNVAGTLRLAKACVKAGARRFIFVSSVAACEAASGPDVDEQSGRPLSAYGHSKLRAEQALYELGAAGLQVTILRPTALFGEDHLGSIYDLTRAISQRRFVIIGPGTNRMNFLYVGDFIDLLLAVEPDPRTFGETFIAADEPITVRELTECIKRGLGQPGSILKTPAMLGYLVGMLCDVFAVVCARPLPLSRRRVAAMTRDVVYHSDKLYALTGFRPVIGVKQGLRRTISWYRASVGL